MSEKLPSCPTIPDPPPCPMRPMIDQQSRSLDEAHTRIREHAGVLSELKSMTTHLVERVSRGETNIADQHRLLVTMQGSLEAVRTEQTAVSQSINAIAQTGRETHTALLAHIEHSMLRDEQSSQHRIADAEAGTHRLIKMTGIAAGILVVLVTLHAAATGQPLWNVLLRLWAP